MFEDDFSDPSSGWEEFEGDGDSAAYADEAWVMSRSDPGGLIANAPVPETHFTDHMELEVAVTGGDESWLAGIILGDGVDNFYLLEIDASEGDAYMTKVVDGFESFDDDIVIGVVGVEDSGVEAGDPNLLSIAVAPDDDGTAMVTFSVNGEQLAEFEDDDPVELRRAHLDIWGLTSTPDGAEIEGTFDDFTLTNLGGTSVSSSTSTSDEGEGSAGGVEDGVFFGDQDDRITLEVAGGQVVLFERADRRSVRRRRCSQRRTSGRGPDPDRSRRVLLVRHAQRKGLRSDRRRPRGGLDDTEPRRHGQHCDRRRLLHRDRRGLVRVPLKRGRGSALRGRPKPGVVSDMSSPKLRRVRSRGCVAGVADRR